MSRRRASRPSGMRPLLVAGAFDPLRNRRADAIPTRQIDARLGPGKHPRNGAQVLNAAGGLAPGRPRTDVELDNLVDGRRLVEIAATAADSPPVHDTTQTKACSARPWWRYHSISSTWCVRSPRVSSTALTSCSRWRCAISGFVVAVADHLALFRDLDAPADRLDGLGQNRAIGRAAASAQRAAAPVEQQQLHAVRIANVGQLALRTKQHPVGHQIAAVFVRVAVADHDLLAVRRARPDACDRPRSRRAAP